MRRLNEIYDKQLDNGHVEWINSRAHLLNSNEAEVVFDDGSKETVEPKQFSLPLEVIPIYRKVYVAADLALPQTASLVLRRDQRGSLLLVLDISSPN